MKKTFVFSCIAIILALSLIEGSMRLFAKPGSFDYVERRNFEQGLHQHKSRDEKRIFLYGESTMHGSHLYTKSTIKDWIRFYLEDLVGKDLADRVTIINYGRVGADSDYIVQSFIDTIVHKPDVAVMYSVHNDFVFLENRKDHLKKKTFQDCMNDFFKSFSKKSVLVTTMRRGTVKRRLDKLTARGGEKSVIDDRWYDETVRKQRAEANNQLVPNSREFMTVKVKWQDNVMRGVKAARASNIPLIFLNGIARYQEFPPYESIHEESLTPTKLSEWEQLHAKADKSFERGNWPAAIMDYIRALAIDPQYAQTYYQLAESYQRSGDLETAYDYYVESNDLDFFPSRAPTAVNAFYRDLAQKQSPPIFVLDIDQTFRSQSAGGIVGRDLIVDNIHPTIQGQALIALDIVRFMYEQELLFSKPDWHWENLKTFEDMLPRIAIDDDFRFDMAMYNGNFVGSYHDEAIKFLKEALQYKPGSVKAKSQLAWVYWLKGEKLKAVEMYRDLEAHAPEACALFFERHPDIAELL